MQTCAILDNQVCMLDNIDCDDCKVFDMHKELELYRQIGSINEMLNETEDRLDETEERIEEIDGKIADSIVKTEEQFVAIKSMTVGDIISAAEYVNCEVVDALGQKILTTAEELYEKSVEHIESKSPIRIFTFDNLSKLGEEKRDSFL